MEEKKPKKSMSPYKNGFVGRLPNARITARKTKEGDWIIIFTRVSKNDWTKKQKNKFDKVVERFGIIYTEKHLRLSDDAFYIMSYGFYKYDEAQLSSNQLP
jgi:hypothetical protein